MIIYDYLITLGAEIRLFWNLKFSASTILFLANRYLSMLYWGPYDFVSFGGSASARVRQRRMC